MKSVMSPITIAIANNKERLAIAHTRHEVYAIELGQYEIQEDGMLPDPTGADITYIVAYMKDNLLGFIGITSPTSQRYCLERYVGRSEISFPFDNHLYEIRALTVLRPFRGHLIAGLLMYAAFRWVESHGGIRILAMGRRETLDMYLRMGLKRIGHRFQCGSVIYELISAEVADLGVLLKRFDSRLRRLENRVDWRLGIAFHRPLECYHGGAFFDSIGDEFDDLRKREGVISADVLDAWYPPTPTAQTALQEHLEWIMRTSPPTHAEGLRRIIAQTRGIEPGNVLPGGGSSQLIFLALRHWIFPSSRVLILDPMYGEYAHVLEKIIRCQVERFILHPNDDFQLNIGKLIHKLKERFDFFIWVNPNNPTGRHVSRIEVEHVLSEAPPCTRIWIDETYVEYAGLDQSLEPFVVRRENAIVCKSLSKVYALSGLRVGYLCGPPYMLEEFRALIPPWSVSLPAQIAAIAAIKDSNYYTMRYQETHVLRKQLTNDLINLGIHKIIPSIANFVMFYLPPESPDIVTVINSCRKQGLFLRDINGMGLSMGRHAIRMTVKDQSTNRKMIEILKSAL